MRRSRLLVVALCVVLVGVGAVLLVVGGRDSPAGTLLGAVIGAAAVLTFHLTRSRPGHAGSRFSTWVLPVAAVVGTLFLASLPEEYSSVAWGFFGGGTLAMAGGLVRSLRRVG